MIINSSNINMKSIHSYDKLSIISKSSTLTNANEKAKDKDDAASLTLSDQGKKQSNRELREKLKMLDMDQKSKEVEDEEVSDVKSKEEANLEILKHLIEVLKRLRQGKSLDGIYSLKTDKLNTSSQGVLDLRSPSVAQNNSGNVWTRQTEVSTFTEEHEIMAFQSTGNVTCADGRSIEFNVSLGMTRSFMESTYSVTEDTVQIMTDPLVINLDSNTASVSDQKFLFDLNSDGKEEEISSLNSGSGFLALDKNNDGKINDGNELFGTKSGDGFKDLAQYDEDHNGWIDEADSVFKDLRVWTKDESGKDKLIDLKEANVGAIFLGNTSSEFSLKDGLTNETNAQIRSTGIYLKETGEASTIQHVDFAL